MTALAGTSSIVVSWNASSSNGGVITGYTATAQPGPATCTTTGALTCVLGATAGTSYTVTVTATANGATSPPSQSSTPATPTAPPVTTTPPATDLNLTTDKGPITGAEPGEEIVFVGTGFAPYSTVVITIYSEPIVLGTVVTDGNGDFSKAVIMPTGLAPASHTVVTQGVAPDGTVRAMKLTVTVAVGAGKPVVANRWGPIVVNGDGAIQMFARGGDNNLATTVQNPDGTWGPWRNLGGLVFSEPVAILNANGRLQVFVIGVDHAIWYSLQNPDNTFTWWRHVHGNRHISSIVVQQNLTGHVQLFGRGSDDNLYTTVQTSTTDPSNWTDWTPLGGVIFSEPTVARHADGRLEVFVIGDRGVIWHRTQIAPGSATWVDWKPVRPTTADRIGL